MSVVEARTLVRTNREGGAPLASRRSRARSNGPPCAGRWERDLPMVGELWLRKNEPLRPTGHAGPRSRYAGAGTIDWCRGREAAAQELVLGWC